MATPTSSITTNVYNFDAPTTPVVENVTLKKTSVDGVLSSIEVSVASPFQASIYFSDVGKLDDCIAVLQYIKSTYM